MQNKELIYTSTPLERGARSRLNLAPHCAGQEKLWLRDLVDVAGIRKQIAECEYEIECLGRVVEEGEPHLNKVGFHELKQIEKILRDFHEGSPRDMRDSLLQAARALRDDDLLPQSLWLNIDLLAGSSRATPQLRFQEPLPPPPRKENPPIVFGTTEKIKITRRKPAQAAPVEPVPPPPVISPAPAKPKILRRTKQTEEIAPALQKASATFLTCLNEVRDGIRNLLDPSRDFAQKYYQARDQQLPFEKRRLKSLRLELTQSLQSRHVLLRPRPVEVMRLRRRV